jgi:hypothetical protein
MHKKILLELKVKGLTTANIADALGVKPLQIYRYSTSEKIPIRRQKQLEILLEKIRSKTFDLEKVETKKLLLELTRRGLRVKID